METDALRPQTLVEYLGQQHIKDVLGVAIRSARIRNATLDHVLLAGPPGLGKTTLSQIIANEMGWQFQTVMAPSLNNALSLGQLFRQMEPKDTVILIDEVHRLRKAGQESLYPALEDRKTMNQFGSRLENIPFRFTMIGATTNIGRLERPFQDRFPLQFQLVYYTAEELAAILAVNARKLEVVMSDDALQILAQRSRSTPRIGNNLLKRLRDYEIAEGVELTAERVEDILYRQLGVDELGLREIDRRYLEVLEPAGEKGRGVEALASRLNEEEDTLSDDIEPMLLRLELIERMPGGRRITQRGIDHLDGVLANGRT
jgi:Holliday junction DNA helicase RuvB